MDKKSLSYTVSSGEVVTTIVAVLATVAGLVAICWWALDAAKRVFEGK